jgi:hypothetical protein
LGLLDIIDRRRGMKSAIFFFQSPAGANKILLSALTSLVPFGEEQIIAQNNAGSLTILLQTERELDLSE